MIRVVLPSTDTTLTFEATPYGDDQSVEVEVNGQLVGTIKLQGVWQPVSLLIPARTLTGQTISTITLRHAHANVPPGSNRQLSAAYRTITLRNANAP